MGEDDVGPKTDELFRQGVEAVDVAIGKSVFDDKVAAFDVAQRAHSIHEDAYDADLLRWRAVPCAGVRTATPGSVRLGSEP